MTFFQELTSNQTLMTGVTGWVVAQVLKTILDIGLNHSFNPERLVGSGGMPIVMYDAIGVRQETGKQARVLNRLLFEDFLKLDGVVLQEKLKEYVGHTPIQVAAGAILGILIAFILDPMFI